MLFDFLAETKSFSIHAPGLETVQGRLRPHGILHIIGQDSEQHDIYSAKFIIDATLTTEDIKMRYRRGIIYVDIEKKQQKQDDIIAVDIQD